MNLERVMEADEAEGDASQLLADALKRMDGLIGEYHSPLLQQPNATASPPLVTPEGMTGGVAASAAQHCERLRGLIAVSDDAAAAGLLSHVPEDTRRLLLTWLSKQDMGGVGGVAEDKEKEDLQSAVVSLEQQVEGGRKENQLLKNNIAMLQSKVTELERSLQEKRFECHQLQEELQSQLQQGSAHVEGPVAGGGVDTPPSSHGHLVASSRRPTSSVSPQGRGGLRQGKAPEPSTPSVTFVGPSEPRWNMRRNDSRRRSFKESISKAFGRKKGQQASLMLDRLPTLDPASMSQRAHVFRQLEGRQLAEWFEKVGLGMYSDLVEQNRLKGEELASIASSNEELVNIGILNTLHCKKLRLAVVDALREHPSPLDTVDHHWVAEWLGDIGLPRYRQTFFDARIDGRMLDNITLDELDLLDVVTPFHLISLRRALQAFRMCGYNPNYLKEPLDSKGSQKLLYWSAQRVCDWLKTVELDEYSAGLHNTGIHGAVILLDVHFTAESLARVLGVSHLESIIWKHLQRKFLEVIGPVAAQKKQNAMKVKSFVFLDPMERVKSHRIRSKSVGKRSREKQVEEYLCPIDEFPATEFISPVSPGGSSHCSTASPPPPPPPHSPPL